MDAGRLSGDSFKEFWLSLLRAERETGTTERSPREVSWLYPLSASPWRMPYAIDD